MGMRYIIEYVKNPREAIGLPQSLKWNVYRVVDGNHYHEEGFRLKREAVNYIKVMS